MKTDPSNLSFYGALGGLGAALVLLGGQAEPSAAQAATGASAAPLYEVAAGWPMALPNKWILGQVSAVAVDVRDHVWVLHRPATVEAASLANDCCVVAPPVVELDPRGAVVQGWGGPGSGYDWPANEHGITVDDDGNVWISGADAADTHLLKFTRSGVFLLQIGRPGQPLNNTDRANLGRPADMRVDRRTNEIYVGDGENGNRRVIVFDATSGAFKRQWGAYGEPTTNEPAPPATPGGSPSRSFSNVHCLDQASDGVVYVCDRGNNRIQAFRADGTFVGETFIAPETTGAGSVVDVAFSPNDALLYVGDGNGKLWVLRRETFEVVGTFGAAGAEPGQFRNLHGVASDSQGNIYTAEAGTGRRVQKFVPRR